METKLSTKNLKIHELNNGVIDVMQTRCITPAIKKIIDIYEQSTNTQTSTQDLIDDIYIIPEFSDELINDLINDKDIIYNKNYKQETYKNHALFYKKWTRKGRTVTLKAYGYKPTAYKYIEHLGNLYFASNEWFLIYDFEPFVAEQFYKLTDTMYCFH